MEVAKLFWNGKSQAVRLPKAFRFTSQQVYIKRVGAAVILLPYQNTWQSLVESLDLFSPDFLEQREQPLPPERDEMFP